MSDFKALRVRVCLPCQRGDCERCMGMDRCTHDCPDIAEMRDIIRRETGR